MKTHIYLNKHIFKYLRWKFCLAAAYKIAPFIPFHNVYLVLMKYILQEGYLRSIKNASPFHMFAFNQ